MVLQYEPFLKPILLSISWPPINIASSKMHLERSPKT